jgi:hypothetical protein
MSALPVSGIIFILTAGGILLGALLRRTLPKHHLNEHAKDVVRLGVGLIAAIAALVLGHQQRLVRRREPIPASRQAPY